jgi:hypothetical protein
VFANPIPPTREEQQTKFAKGVSVTDVLLARAAVIDAWTNYSLVFDGDGVTMHEM